MLDESYSQTQSLKPMGKSPLVLISPISDVGLKMLFK